MDRILEIAACHQLKVIEDAAHALPARYKGKMVGTIGDITCFSFYATKTLTTGEGGMVGTENKEYADRMRLMSLHGISKDAWKRYSMTGSWKYEILRPGYKYNMTDLQAALGLTQLGKCDSMWTRRALLAGKYTTALGSLDAFEIPHVAAHVQHAWHLYVILVDNAVLRIHRDQVIEELRARGIGASVHFIPLHLHPYYQSRWSYRLGDFPVAEHYFDRCISLPIYPSMTDEDADRVIESLYAIAARFRR
jgi:perosamine synthetase